MIKHGTWTLLLAACLVVGASPAADGTQAADPAWGDYAGLAGRTARAGTEGYQLRWYWAEPGKELVQEYRNPGDGSVAHREVITLGASPGTLMLQSSVMGKKRWNGTVQPDGRVLFIGKGLLKLPYLAGEAEDGTWQIRGVELDDGRIASVDEVTSYSRYAFEEPGATAGGGTDDAADSATATPPAVAAPDATLVAAPVAATVPVVPAATATVATATAATAGPTRSRSMFGKLAKSLGLGGDDTADGPPPVIHPDFGVMEQFIGQRFIYQDWIANISTIEEGRTLVIQYGTAIYHLRATVDPDQYEVPVHPSGYHGAKAQRLHDGTLEINLKYWSVDDMLGQLIRLRLKKNDYGAFDITREVNFRFAMGGWEWSATHTYRPYTADVVAQERESARRAREDRAWQARERAIQQAESDAAWNRALSTMSNNLSDYAAREQQRMAESQAMLDEINARARAEAEAQRYAEQQAAQQYATQQQMAQQQQAARQQQALAQQQAAMRDRQSQVQAQPARSTGGTGSWETAGQSSAGSPSPAGRASTHSDPSGCVTPPVLGPNRACGKGTSASITNQCPQVVDARMCLMTPRGWDCGARYGLQPGDSWSWASCSGTDEVFHDVRSSDSDEPLAEP